MSRFLLVVACLIAACAPAAQRIFTAPTMNNVVASSEPMAGDGLGHVLYVTNGSSVPVIVFGVGLRNCENVKQTCESRAANITVHPGARTEVGRVEPKSAELGFAYRWSFSWRADSSDARLRDAMRASEAALRGGVASAGDPVAVDGAVTPTVAPTTPARRAVAASGVSATPARAESDSTRLARQRAATLRYRVAPGSIVADAQLGRNPPIAVGACLDPVAAARFELDRSLELVPEVAPVLSGGITLPTLPESLHDSEARTGVVVARWVVDTNGTTIPESVTIVSSPHGLMSVKVCGAILAAHLTPARDDGKVVRSRVEMPVRFVP